MDGFVKGGLMIFLWLGINYFFLNSVSIPVSDTVACIIPAVTFVASGFIVEMIDKSISGGKRDCSDELYPKNWDELRNQDYFKINTDAVIVVATTIFTSTISSLYREVALITSAISEKYTHT